jgi:sulfur carrier protein
MIIFCNGKERQVGVDTTLSDLLVELQLDPETVVVECNKNIVNPEKYDVFILPDTAQVEIIRFVGGG